MAGLDLLPIGIGDAFSTKHYSTCLALRAEGRWILLDCPHPIRKMLREASLKSGLSLDLPAIDAIVLTHLHADHASGVEGYGFHSRYTLGRRGRIVAHPDVSKRLWDGHLSGSMQTSKGRDSDDDHGLADYFELVDLDDRRPVQVGPFAIECRRTKHPVPTTAFRIQAGGRTLGFSSDTEYDPELIAWLSPADLVLHETGPQIHTPLEPLLALPASLRAKMRLVHLDDRDRFLSCGIEPLEEGRLVQVG